MFGSSAGNFFGRGFFRKEVLIVLIIGLAIRYFVGFFLTYTYDVHSWALIISNFESGNGLYDCTTLPGSTTRRPGDTSSERSP